MFKSLLISLVSIVSICHGHMSMDFPAPRAVGPTSASDCTSPFRSSPYLTWEWNEPMVPARPCVCHHTQQDATIRPENVITAGATVSIGIAGSAFHNGGHCSYWVSADGITFEKFVDSADCTTRAVNNQAIDIVFPATLNAACASRCIFAWTWIPRSSGACEVYMTCADIQVVGAVGGGNPIQSINFVTGVTSATCSRIDAATGWSSLFTPYNTTGMSGGPAPSGTPPPAVTQRPTMSTTAAITGTNAPQGTRCELATARTLQTTWGSINRTTPGRCGPGIGVCDWGTCCSAAGYCGPDLTGYDSSGNPIYTNYDVTPNAPFTSEILAFQTYCNNSLADFRLFPCCSIVNSLFDSNLLNCDTLTGGGTSGAVGVKVVGIFGLMVAVLAAFL